jgi:8-oxo-dGTP pyrophosphatase MutT (NUDIX family)
MSIQRFGKWDFRGVDPASAARALARLREQGAPAEPERAAAVVLLREAPLRVFLLRHPAKEPFGASAPNHESSGLPVLDRVDLPTVVVRERWAHLDVDGYGDRIVNGRSVPRGVQYGFPGGRHKPDDPDVAMTGVRAVEEETGAMVALQRAWARWVTPEYEPVRFDSWIYVATLAEGFQPRIRVREPEYATWIGPEQAVCQYGGQMSMPEATTLAELSRYSTVGEVFASAEQRDMSPILPRVSLREGDASIVLPGEEGYPANALAAA